MSESSSLTTSPTYSERIERMLRQSQRMGRIGCFEWELGAERMYWTDMMFHMLGIPVASGNMMDVAYAKRFIHPDDMATIAEKCALLPELDAWEYLFRLVTTSGDVLLVSVWVEIVETQDVGATRVWGTCHDVTREQTWEQELRRQKGFAEQIIEHSVDCIFVFNPNLTIAAWNRQCEIEYKILRAEAIGKRITDLFPGVDFSAVEERLKRALVGELIHIPVEQSYITNTYWEGFVIPLMDAGGEVIHVVSILRNITDRIEQFATIERMNAQLTHSNDALQRLNAEMVNFSYAASHDLQEPLRKIQAFISILQLKEQNKLSETGKDYFQRIHGAAARMQQMIDGLLNYARANPMLAARKKVLIGDIVAAAATTVRDKLIHLDAQLDIQVDGVVQIIPDQFEQMLVHVLANAIKFKKPGIRPVICIRTSVVAADDIQGFVPEFRDNFLRLSIQDNGIGFPPEQSERIFDMFYRLHGNSEYTGAGIGLAICRRIAQNHNGYIMAESTPGNGATFYIYVPLQ